MTWWWLWTLVFWCTIILTLHCDIKQTQGCSWVTLASVGRGREAEQGLTWRHSLSHVECSKSGLYADWITQKRLLCHQWFRPTSAIWSRDVFQKHEEVGKSFNSAKFFMHRKDFNPRSGVSRLESTPKFFQGRYLTKAKTCFFLY